MKPLPLLLLLAICQSTTGFFTTSSSRTSTTSFTGDYDRMPSRFQKLLQEQRLRKDRQRYSKLLMAMSDETSTAIQSSFNYKMNEFFKKPVPTFVRDFLNSTKITSTTQTNFTISELLLSSCSNPGVPRPLWIVILGSVPTGLLWYGYYKFNVEEELMEHDIQQNKIPRGFGGYGTLGPFVYGILLGPIAELLHIPGGYNWSNIGIIFIYYTQFLLYDRVNELYKEEGISKQPPLSLWWTLPIFFPFDLIVGLRQVHLLSQYLYRQRGLQDGPKDPVVEFFPFIGADRFTWQEFLTTPSLWCKWTSNIDPIDRNTLPQPIQNFLSLGEESYKSSLQKSKIK